MEKEYGKEESKLIKEKIGVSLKEYFKENPVKFTEEQHQAKKLAFFEHEEHVQNEIDKFTEGGFKCIRLSSNPIPDFIAVKDGKIYAVEIEMLHGNYHKSHTEKYIGKDFYDEVIWLNKSSMLYKERRKKEK